MATVVLIGTLDSKGPEYAFLRDAIKRAGCATIMINAGVLADPDYRVDYGRADVAAAAGEEIDRLAVAGDRGRAVAVQAEGAAVILSRLHSEGWVDGVVGLGGSGGTSLVSEAMRRLPIGVPKLLVSTLASGDTSEYVDISDIVMMPSIVDIAGVNMLSAQILGNAAGAIAGMARSFEARDAGSDPRPLIGATQYGTTTPCVNVAREYLEEAGYEVLVFHATGPGGRSMESLMASGHIVGVLDITTTELVDEVAGGTTTAGPERLDMAGSLALPQVVSVGASDQVTFRPPTAMPDSFSDRVVYRHNQNITLARSSPDEMREYGRLLCEKLNRAKGPVSLFIPLRGFSEYSTVGGVFHDPEADLALIEVLREDLGEEVELVEMECAINAPEFATAMAQRLVEYMEGRTGKGEEPAV